MKKLWQLAGFFRACIPVVLISFSSYADIVFASNLSGTVYLSGVPLPDTSIQLIDAETDISLAELKSDGFGAYRFDLNSGRYHLLLRPPMELGLSPIRVENIEIDKKDVTYHIVMLPPATILSGVLRTPDGTPIRSVELSIYDVATRQNVGVVNTDIDGRYSFPVAKGTYYINAKGAASQSNVAMPDSWHIYPLVKDLNVQQETYYEMELPLVSLSGKVYDVINRPATEVNIGINRTWHVDEVQYKIIENVKSATLDGSYHTTLFSGSGYSVSLTPTISSGMANEVFNDIDIFIDSNRDFKLSQTHELSGKITEPNGNPVSGVLLVAIEQFSNSVVASVKSDADGNFTVPVSSGVYSINIGGYGYDSNIRLPSNWNITNFYRDVQISQDTKLDVVLPISRLRAHIVDEFGADVVGATISGTNSWNVGNTSYLVDYSKEYTITGNSGRCELISFVFDNYSFDIQPGMASGLANTAVNNVDLRFDATHTYKLASQVTASGEIKTSTGLPVDNVLVTFLDINDRSNVVSVLSNGQGFYQSQVKPGNYLVWLDGSGNEINVAAPDRWYIHPQSASVDLTTDAVHNFEIPFVELKGIVKDSNGVPINDSELTVTKAWINNAVAYYVHNASGNRKSDITGKYSLPLLSYHNYSVSITPFADSGFASATFDNIDASADTFRDFILLNNKVLSGTVKSPKGEIISGVNLLLYDQIENRLIAQTTSDESGHYHFKLVSGLYKINANGYAENSNIALPQNWFINPLIKNININSDTQLDIELPVIFISGQTMDSNGVAIADVGFGVDQRWSDGIRNYYLKYSETRNRSDINGHYSLGVFPFENYSEFISAPKASGFLDASISGLAVVEDIKQDVILVYADSLAPVLVSAPIVRHLSTSTAVIEWQSDEPATCDVFYRLLSSNDSNSTIGSPGYSTIHSVTLDNLESNAEYEFIVSCSDYAGNGPTQSIAQLFSTPNVEHTHPPQIIKGPHVYSVTDSNAIIRWETDKPVTTKIFYGQDPQNLDSTLSKTGIRVVHELNVNELESGTGYYFYVEANDKLLSSTTKSEIENFTTLETQDDHAPQIVSGPTVLSITDKSAIIVWETNEPSTSGISYNDGQSYGVLSDDNLVAMHEMHVTGLEAATKYNYTVSSKDVLGNGPVLSTEQEFTTLENGDTSPPNFIIEPTIVTITHQSVVIRWSTDEPANSIIEYGLNENNLDQHVSRAALVKNHTLPIVGLSKDTEYYFRVISEDMGAQYSVSSELLAFNTHSMPDTANVKLIGEPKLIPLSLTSATILWHTSKPTDSVIHYGNNNIIDKQKEDSKYTTEHRITLRELMPEQRYSYMIHGRDIDGNRIQFESAHANFIQTTLNTDNASPQLETDVDIEYINDNTVVLKWRTDELASSTVSWRQQGESLNWVLGEVDFDNYHILALPNLSPGTPYEFKIVSRDAVGNESNLQQGGFTTGFNNDNMPPSILSQSVVSTANITSANIYWQSNEFSSAQIQYGFDPDNLDLSIKIEELGRKFSVDINNLHSGIIYYFQINNTDMAGNNSEPFKGEFNTRGMALDWDKDTIADVYDGDDDNDGIPDATELSVGLNAYFWQDANQDLDGDGISNLDEFLAGTSITTDSTPPQIITPANVTLHSTGPYMLVDYGRAIAIDRVDGTVSTNTLANSVFPPGSHTITWNAQDAAGNVQHTTQLLNVVPQVNFGSAISVKEGDSVILEVYLNGEAVSYPVVINYSIGGTASSPEDHNVTKGSIIIDQGMLGQLPITIAKDAFVEGTETLIIDIESAINAVIGPHSQKHISIVEHDITPNMSLQISQNNQYSRFLSRNQGPVKIEAVFMYKDVSNKYIYSWQIYNEHTVHNLNSDQSEVEFDLSHYDDEIYTIKVSARNTADSGDSIESQLDFRVNKNTLFVKDENFNGIRDEMEYAVGSSVLQLQSVMNSGPSIGNKSQYGQVLIAEAGTHMSVGDVAFRLDNSGALISGDFVTNFAELNGMYDTDLFDFIIDRLNEVGQTVSVVIPVSTINEGNGQFEYWLDERKWQAFQKTGDNQIAYASGDGKTCPTPESVDYLYNLNTAYRCMQLSITDGGPNDMDGKANGKIKVLGRFNSISDNNNTGSATARSESGAGLFNAILLSIFFMYAVYRRQRCH